MRISTSLDDDARLSSVSQPDSQMKIRCRRRIDPARARYLRRSLIQARAITACGSPQRQNPESLSVPETPQTSRGLLILVDERAEAVVSFDLVDLGCGVTGEWSCGSGLPQGAVRPVIVVVAFEFV
jgi:hypothetical protein